MPFSSPSEGRFSRAVGPATLRGRLFALALIAVVILLVGGVALVSVRAYRADSDAVAHTHEVQRALANVLQRLVDAETGQRGFLLTRDDRYLDPYRRAGEDVDRTLGTLRELVRENGDQTARVDSLGPVARLRLIRLDSVLAGFREFGRVPPADELLVGKLQMDEVRRRIQTMDSTENELLLLRQEAVVRQGQRAIATIVIGSIASFLLLVWVTIGIRLDLASNARLRQQSEQSETRYRFLADAIPVQIWTSDPKGQLDFVSARVAEYFGTSAEQLLRDGWLSVLHPDDVPRVVERWTHSLTTAEPYEVEFRLRGADGNYRWHIGRAVAQVGGDGQVVTWFGSNTDIDEQRRTVEERERLIGALERSNRELDQFAYVTSHDLKAPLRGIANLSGWIEEDMGPGFPATAQEHMRLLRGRVHRMEALIDGILDYSRAGRTRVAPEPIDTRALVLDTVQMLALPESAEVSVGESMPSVVAGRVPLGQIFSNLIGNAVKHGGGEKARVRVSADADSARPGYVRFSVSDNGPGIPAQYHERVFGVFQTLAARDKVEGTGIGLSIVKKLVEGQGGRVWIESPAVRDAATAAGTDTKADAPGTTIHFTWPRVPGPER